MKSPFPGMDPYLEHHWSDIHVKLTAFIAETLSPMLPDALRVRSEERILLEEFAPEIERLQSYRQADVAVTERDSGDRGAATAVLHESIPEPIMIEYEEIPQKERWIQIIDSTNGDRVVTVIEILSPGNKESGGLNQSYRRKVSDYLRAGVGIVEIDLLRSSRERLPIASTDLPLAERTPYAVCVKRGGYPGRWEVYPIKLRQRIPTIPIPLRREDKDVPLSLQPLIDRIYAIGRYDDIDYTKPPVPPLSPEDQAWAEALLKVGGRG